MYDIDATPNQSNQWKRIIALLVMGNHEIGTGDQIETITVTFPYSELHDTNPQKYSPSDYSAPYFQFYPDEYDQFH